MNRDCGFIQFVWPALQRFRRSIQESTMTRTNQQEEALQTTSCYNATAGNRAMGNLRRDLLSLRPLPSRQTFIPGYAVPPKKYEMAWRPVCRDPSFRTATSFPEGSKGNRSSRWDGRSLPQAVSLPKKTGACEKKQAWRWIAVSCIALLRRERFCRKLQSAVDDRTR